MGETGRLRRTADSFANFLARLGYNAGSQQDGAGYQFDYVSRNRIQMEAAYRSNWIAGMAVDTVAEDMTRAGVEITSEIDPDAENAIERVFGRYQVWDNLQDAIKWSRLYGGCLAVVMIDGQDVSTPLNIDAVGRDQFRGLQVLDRWQVSPTLQDLVRTPGPAFGLPRYYQVVADAQVLNNEMIHHSRVIRLDGVRLPYWQRIAENLWGQSVLERLWDRLVAFDSTTEGAAQLVYKAHLRTYKVEGLREIIALGGDAMKGLLAQIDMIRQFQSNEGLTLMDAKDEFEAHAYAFSGLSDMMLQFGQQLSGALQIPLVRLFGQSPAGLNSSGDADLRTYYDNVLARQNSQLRPGLHLLFEIVSRSETGKPLDDDFTFEFRSLWQMTDTDKASVAGAVGTVLNTLEGSGNISHAVVLRELRAISRSTGIFSSITDEDITEAEAEPPRPRELDLPGGPPEPGQKPGQKPDDAE